MLLFCALKKWYSSVMSHDGKGPEGCQGLGQGGRNFCCQTRRRSWQRCLPTFEEEFGSSESKRGTSAGPEWGLCVKLCERTARDAFVLSSLPPSFFGRFKEPPCYFNLPARHARFLGPEEILYNLSMMSPAVRWQSAQVRWAHPPVANSPPDTQPASSIEKRYALLPICCAVK